MHEKKNKKSEIKGPVPFSISPYSSNLMPLYVCEFISKKKCMYIHMTNMYILIYIYIYIYITELSALTGADDPGTIYTYIHI
jgi:hypothetical protein